MVSLSPVITLKLSKDKTTQKIKPGKSQSPSSRPGSPLFKPQKMVYLPERTKRNTIFRLLSGISVPDTLKTLPGLPNTQTINYFLKLP
jgi:hypothetical protein